MEINIYDFKISESRRIADFEEQYAGCDPDWENIERAAEKGIVAGALWFADLVAKVDHLTPQLMVGHLDVSCQIQIHNAVVIVVIKNVLQR